MANGKHGMRMVLSRKILYINYYINKMDRYNPFPISGPISVGDQLYLGVYEVNSDGEIIPGSFKYVTYQTNNGEIYGHVPISFEIDGTPVFDDNIELVIFTYERGGNSTAAFYTNITGKKQYLYTTKKSFTMFSSKQMFYTTQGLHDLWAGYFNSFIVKDTSDKFMEINMKTPSIYITAIPAKTIYEPDSCNGTDNSKGQGLSSAIEDFKNNTNGIVYYTNQSNCQKQNIVNYCQNQWSSPSLIGSLTCNGTITYDNGAINNCLGMCSNYILKDNTPLCTPKNSNLKSFSCKKYNRKGNFSKPFYLKTWFIILISVLVLLAIIMIMIVIFKK